MFRVGGCKINDHHRRAEVGTNGRPPYRVREMEIKWIVGYYLLGFSIDTTKGRSFYDLGFCLSTGDVSLVPGFGLLQLLEAGT